MVQAPVTVGATGPFVRINDTAYTLHFFHEFRHVSSGACRGESREIRGKFEGFLSSTRFETFWFIICSL